MNMNRSLQNAAVRSFAKYEGEKNYVDLLG